MSTLLFPNRGKGKEIYEFVRDALGIPKTVQLLEIRFAVGEPIGVKCEFPACDTEAPTVVDTTTPDKDARTYSLVENGSAVR